MAQTARPLSPHLQIYKWQITMALSILHRATGIVLALGSLLLVSGLLSLASGPDTYARFAAVAGSLPGQVLLFGWTWALCYHLLNGIRHLAWDAGHGYDIPTVTVTGWVAVVLSLVFTFVIWGVVLMKGGAA